jgi:pilus assembly protein CpaE
MQRRRLSVKISVISKDDKHLFDIVKLLRERNPSHTINAVFGTLEKLSGMAELAAPDALVLDQPSVESGDLERLEHMGQQHPRMAFILLCQQQSPEFLLQAMRAGVREVLSAPMNGDALLKALARIEEKLDNRTQANGKVLAFISCKGGSGATFVAANLGYALALQEKRRVALIDLNLQFGDAALLVSDQNPLATLADVSQQIHRLDPSLLASSMVNVAPNYSVLAAPEDPTHASDIKPEHIDAILKVARRQYDFILLDIGHNLDPVSIRALDQSDMIFPVLQASLPYIRDGKRLLGVFRALDYGKEKIHLIINRHEKNDDITVHDMEAAFGADIFWKILNDHKAASASVNQGVPILKTGEDSPLARSLQELAQMLTGEAGAPVQGWLARIFQRA